MSSAAADQDLSIVQIPKVSRYWRSRLEDGPRRTHGRWLPGTSNQKPMLDCIPCQTEEDKTIYTVSFSTTVPDAAPVMAGKRSIINFKSRLDRPADLYVGMTMKTAEGNFAGRFQVVLPNSEFQSGAAFNYSIEIEDFTLASLSFDNEERPRHTNRSTDCGIDVVAHASSTGWTCSHLGGTHGEN